MADDSFECLIIGGGPAGLSAALQMARYNRCVALFDNGKGRSTWSQVNHNYLGFPGGIEARQLRELGRQQLAEYPHVTIIDHKISQMEQTGAGFIASGQAGTWQGRSVIICTGVLDHYPHFAGWEEYVGRSMFWCITCDGYETRGKRVVILGEANEAASEAMQMLRFTNQITVLTGSHDCQIDEKFSRRLAKNHIPLICDKLDSVEGHDGMIEAICTQSGQRIALDRLFSVQGATPETALAADLGVKLNERGYILADLEQNTNVKGVFAAGDVTRNFDQQVATAVHEGLQAACAANYYLYPPELQDD